MKQDRIHYLSGATIADEDKFEGGNILFCGHSK
jgi:hypothetical protein